MLLWFISFETNPFPKLLKFSIVWCSKSIGCRNKSMQLHQTELSKLMASQIATNHWSTLKNYKKSTALALSAAPFALSPPLLQSLSLTSICALLCDGGLALLPPFTGLPLIHLPSLPALMLLLLLLLLLLPLLTYLSLFADLESFLPLAIPFRGSGERDLDREGE